MSKKTLPYEIEKWSLLVGRFILAFGEIELACCKLWEELFPHKQPPDTFKKKADKLIGALKAKGLVSKNSDDPVGLLIAARSLADKRNTIAHNPMQTQVWHNRATNDYHIELAIYSDKNEHYLTDNELEILHEEAAHIGRHLFIFITDMLWTKDV